MADRLHETALSTLTSAVTARRGQSGRRVARLARGLPAGPGLLTTVAALLRFASYRRLLLMLGAALLAATIVAGLARPP
jgi:hypothetical protein